MTQLRAIPIALISNLLMLFVRTKQRLPHSVSVIFSYPTREVTLNFFYFFFYLFFFIFFFYFFFFIYFFYLFYFFFLLLILLY